MFWAGIAAVAVGLLLVTVFPKIFLESGVDQRSAPNVAAVTSASAVKGTSTPPEALNTSMVAPKNNQILSDAYPESSARGELQIDNGTSEHSIVKLIDRLTDAKILSFTVCAHRKAHVGGVPDGEYDVLFAFGDQIYEGSDRFFQPHGFSKFVSPITFATRATNRTIEWDRLSLTLHPVFAGNVRTTALSQSEFDRY
jgi:hypothetical protein